MRDSAGAMECPECRVQNPEGAKFCSSCGSPLRLLCPKCGELNRPGARFCNECGSPLAVKEKTGRELSFARDAVALDSTKDFRLVPEGERKLVTALFVDII